jgi:hypothetical protein
MPTRKARGAPLLGEGKWLLFRRCKGADKRRSLDKSSVFSAENVDKPVDKPRDNPVDICVDIFGSRLK